MIAIVSYINIAGARRSADVQNWTTAAKIIAILGMSLVLVTLGHGWSRSTAPSQPSQSWPSGLAISVSMMAVLWAYEGWQYCTFSAGETKDAQRTFPRAFFIGLAALIGIYVFAVVGYLFALGPQAAAASDRVAATAFAAVVGPKSAKLLAAIVLTSIFSASNGTVLTVPRVFYAMAEDGLFFRKLAEVHPRYRTPAFAITAGSVWAGILTVTGTFERLLTFVVFTGWIFYGLAAATIFVYRKRFPAESLPYRVPGYPVTPVVFILSAGAIVLNTIVSQPLRAAIGVGIVLVGLPAYAVWSKRLRNAGERTTRRTQ
jgi:APA family basic amino acid/polyamine antiporter